MTVLGGTTVLHAGSDGGVIDLDVLRVVDTVEVLEWFHDERPLVVIGDLIGLLRPMRVSGHVTKWCKCAAKPHAISRR